MKNNYFKKYSLVLVKDNKVIFRSQESNLKPLIKCIKVMKNKKDCILYDKVIGLAAAKLIVYSKFISSVITEVISQSGADYLKSNNIDFETKRTVDNILNSNKTAICPMELKAQEIKEEKEFFGYLIE